MRDFAGLNAALVPTETEDLNRYLPVLRRDIDHLDYFLRDLSRGIQRIQVGRVPDGSGNTIINQVISDLYWYKPGMPSGTHLAYGSQAPAGSATIGSTANIIKGFTYLGSSSGLAFDETNTRVGLNQGTPTARLHMVVPPPVSQFARPFLGTGPTSGSSNIVCGPVPPTSAVWETVDDVGSDTAGTDYDRWDWTSQTTAILTLALNNVGNITDPGTNVGWAIHVTMRTTTSNAAGPVMQMALTLGGPSIFSPVPTWGNPIMSPVPNQGNITSSLVRYTYNLTSTGGGDAAQLRAAMSTQWTLTFTNSGLGAVGQTWDISQVELEVPNPGAGSAETLQKWATSGSILDQLDFADDGASGTDLKLSGNSELFVNVGDASSGLRFYSLSSTAYIEAGTTAQAAMNLILGGNRASTGTLLTSNFTNTRLAGALQLNGATSGRLTMQAAAITTDHTLTWPAAQPGSASFLSNTAGTLSWTASSGFAASTEPYVVISATAGLSAERVLTGTANQIIYTDNGANSTVVASTPQNLHTSTVFQVGTLGIGAAAAAGLELDVTGEATFRSTVNVITATDIDTLVLHYRSSVLAIPGKPFRAIDDDGGAPEFYIDGSTGYMVGGGFALGSNSGSSGFRLIQVAAVLTADRVITWADRAGTPQLLSGTQTSSAIMTWSGVQTFSSATRPLFKAGITIEDPGAGTNTISMIAPTAPTTHTLTWPGANAAGTLNNDGAGILSWAAAGGTHAMLSTTHSDSVANAVSRGSLIYGNATPAWDELVIGTSGFVLKSNGTDAAWADLFGAANIWTAAQTFNLAALFKTSIVLEDPGAGTNTVSIVAPATPTTHTLTLPGANAAGALQNNGSGTLSWSYAFSDATFNLFQAGTPTAQLFWNLAAISGGSSRTWTVQDWSGNPVVPSSNGTSGQVLTSQGAGTQPIWSAAAASDPAYSPGSFTVATETARLQPRHLKLTTTQRATLAGTATLRMT